MADHVMPVADILKKLLKLGYFGLQTWNDIKNLKPAAVARAVKQYQQFNGLPDDGEVGPKTANVLNRPRCGRPDFEMRLNISGDTCRWPMKEVTYASQINLPGITPQQAIQAYDQAAAQWMAICGIKLTRVAPGKANIYAKSGVGRANNLDNRGGTLAWSELPCDVNVNTQLDQMYDEAESWSYNMAVAVICHEMGHALGLPHLPKGNLMAAYYDPNTTKPQQGDIVEMVDRYGNVVSPPPVVPGQPPIPNPTPNVPGMPDVSGVITINGIPFVLTPRN